jgi:hypothetical protein
MEGICFRQVNGGAHYGRLNRGLNWRLHGRRGGRRCAGRAAVAGVARAAAAAGRQGKQRRQEKIAGPFGNPHGDPVFFMNETTILERASPSKCHTLLPSHAPEPDGMGDFSGPKFDSGGPLRYRSGQVK